MSAFKLITFLFPFLREMVLGEKTIREALKTNKTRVLMLVLTCLVYLGFLFAIPKLIHISADYVILEKKVDALTKECEAVHCSTAERGAQESAAASEKETPKEAAKPPPAPEKPIAASEVQLVVPTPQPDPVPDDRKPPPSVDIPTPPPKKPVAQHPSRTKPHPTPKPPETPKSMSAVDQERYNDWRKTFDDIKASEEHEQWTRTHSIYEKH